MIRTMVVLSVLWGVAACADPPEEDPTQGATDVEVETDGAPTEPATSDTDGLPLRVIMQRMSVDMARFTEALWLEDFSAMAERADAIADHPHMAPMEVERIEAELEAEMADFQEADEVVHLAALRLLDASEARELDAVLDALADVQRGCVSCHTRFRERLQTTQP